MILVCRLLWNSRSGKGLQRPGYGPLMLQSATLTLSAHPMYSVPAPSQNRWHLCWSACTLCRMQKSQLLCCTRSHIVVHKGCLHA